MLLLNFKETCAELLLILEIVNSKCPGMSAAFCSHSHILSGCLIEKGPTDHLDPAPSLLKKTHIFPQWSSTTLLWLLCLFQPCQLWFNISKSPHSTLPQSLQIPLGLSELFDFSFNISAWNVSSVQLYKLNYTLS